MESTGEVMLQRYEVMLPGNRCFEVEQQRCPRVEGLHFWRSISYDRGEWQRSDFSPPVQAEGGWGPTKILCVEGWGGGGI